MKILSPAGNFESLKMAVFNGADEVYLGISDFNARNNIEGFSIDTLKEAVDFAHLFKVKVHLAINILFSDSELQDAINVVGQSLNLGVDAFIVQDLGLISLINKLYPEAEIHLSTQMGIHNLEGILALKDYKFKRVVLSRETPLEEIKRIKENTNVEIEYFAQGALCVSFSGNCYLSSYTLSASGNRGKCKQLCRLPFTFSKNGKKLKQGYLLSAKDFNMLNRLSDLKKAGVDAIKIEGRARRPYYVGVATREYYNALHGLNADLDELKLAFNRNYTEGYFNGNGNIISDFQSHIGIFVGRVLRVKNGKKFNEIYFSSNRKISIKSTLKFFFNGEEKTVSAFDLKQINKNEYLLTTTNNIESGSLVHLIVDYEKENNTLSLTKKVPIEIDLFAEKNAKIRAEFKFLGRKHTVFGEKLISAEKQPLTENELKENFSKSQIFNVKVNVKKLDNVFILKKNLNEFRREVLQKIYDVLTQNDKCFDKKTLPKVPVVNGLNDFIIIDNLDKDFLGKNVIYSPEKYDEKDIKNFADKCKEQNKNAYLDTPNFALKSDIELLKTMVKNTGVGVVANNYYALTLSENYIIGAGLNVYNSFTAFELKKPFITAEGDMGKRINFAYMTLRHCPMKNLLNASCEKCPFEDGFTYKMDSGKVMKLKRKKLASCTFYLTD